jgi:putative chitinase
MDRFAIDATTRRQAAFLAQVAHESDAFSMVIESMNYSAQGLMETWPLGTRPDGSTYGFFNAANAGAYAHNAEAIGNLVYANRDGNGDEASGDGYRFRGRGPLQTSGRTDYGNLANVLGQPILTTPDLLCQPVYGALAAAWEWNRGNLNDLADLGTEEAFDSITRVINGGFIGQPDRLARWIRAKSALGVLS